MPITNEVAVSVFGRDLLEGATLTFVFALPRLAWVTLHGCGCAALIRGCLCAGQGGKAGQRSQVSACRWFPRAIVLPWALIPCICRQLPAEHTGHHGCNHRGHHQSQQP